MKKITNINREKRAYFNNIPFRSGEITVITSKNATASMKHSSRLAADISASGLSALIINCAVSKTRFSEYFCSKYQEAAVSRRVGMKTSVQGNLIGEQEQIDQIVSELRPHVIIINGWEWTSSSWRRKERLLFYLRELMEEHNLTIIIYSHTANAPVPGEIDRGGIGKLSMLAVFVVEIETSQEMETSLPKPPPAIFESPDEEIDAKEGAQLLINKIKDLEGGDGDLAMAA